MSFYRNKFQKKQVTTLLNTVHHHRVRNNVFIISLFRRYERFVIITDFYIEIQEKFFFSISMTKIN